MDEEWREETRTLLSQDGRVGVSHSCFIEMVDRRRGMAWLLDPAIVKAASKYQLLIRDGRLSLSGKLTVDLFGVSQSSLAHQ